MTRFSYNADSGAPNFDLSHDALEPIHRGLAAYAKKRGQVARYNDVYPVTADGPRPVAYVAPIDPRVVQGIFHPDDETLIADDECAITYCEPNLMYPYGEHSTDVVREDITILLKWRLGESGLGLNEYYWISKRDGVVSADITPEYFDAEGKRISPNNLETGRGLTDEAIIETIEDLHALERPLTIDDSEKLHQLIEVHNG